MANFYVSGKPAGSDAPSTLNDTLDLQWAGLQAIMAVDHDWTVVSTLVTGTTLLGGHNVITCIPQSTPSPAADLGYLYSKTVTVDADQEELFYHDHGWTGEIQLTHTPTGTTQGEFNLNSVTGLSCVDDESIEWDTSGDNDELRVKVDDSTLEIDTTNDYVKIKTPDASAVDATLIEAIVVATGAYAGDGGAQAIDCGITPRKIHIKNRSSGVDAVVMLAHDSQEYVYNESTGSTISSGELTLSGTTFTVTDNANNRVNNNGHNYLWEVWGVR